MVFQFLGQNESSFVKVGGIILEYIYDIFDKVLVRSEIISGVSAFHLVKIVTQPYILNVRVITL